MRFETGTRSYKKTRRVADDNPAVCKMPEYPHHRDRPHGPVSLQPEPDLSGVLPVPARYRDLGQQRVAAGYTRRRGGADPLFRHRGRRAVPGKEIRCAILGL